ncbi:MAG: TolC family protein [Rhodoferax sp.]|uniref:TolC family protein n=1 Tax=Rhodoferax sp. TaxID=50421 RepID=UPI003266183C
MPLFFWRAAAWAAAMVPCLVAAAPLSLDDAIALAVQRSEASRSAQSGVDSAKHMALAAGQLPDPSLRVGIDNLPVTGPDRFHTDRDFMTMKRIGISQEWLSSGKRATRQAAAEAAVARETIQVQTAQADTRLQTALAYVDAYFASESLKLSTLMEHHAHEELEAARARLSSSTGNSQEVLFLSSASGMAADDTAEVLQQQSSAKLALQRWTGVASDDLQMIGKLPWPSEADYVAAAPAVAALRRDVEVARQTATVTATNRQANWTWEVSYAQRTGYSDMVSVGVTIPLQLAPAQRQDQETAAKWALFNKTEADLAEATRNAAVEYRSLASDTQRLQERIDRYRSTVALPAGQRIVAATAAYGSNQGSLVTLFEARHAEVDAQRKLLALQRDLTRAQAQLLYKPVSQGDAP